MAYIQAPSKEHFYIYLPSANQDGNSYASNYRVKLSDRINLMDSNKYEVGLFAIDYRKSWRNFPYYNNVVYKEKVEDAWQETEFRIPEIEYDGVVPLLQVINSNIPGTERTKKAKFEYIERLNRVRWIIKNPENINNVSINLGQKLSKMLGFNKPILEKQKQQYAPARARISDEIDRLFIHTDIIKPVMVGGDYVKLLRLVNVPENAKFDDNIREVFDVIQWCDLSKGQFDTIHVSISSETGGLVPFANRDDVTLILHFRRKAPHAWLSTNPY